MKLFALTLTLAITLSSGLYSQMRRYASTPIVLSPVVTTSTSVLIPIVNTFPPVDVDGTKRFSFEYFYWELATDSNFAKVVAYQLWRKNLGDVCLTKRDTIPVLIEGILPDTKFFFRVQALNFQPLVFDPFDPTDPLQRRDYFSTFTSPIPIQTPARSLPLAPRLLLSTNIAHNSFTLNWLLSPGLPTEYEVQVSPDSTFQSGVITRITNSLTIAISGLSPNTRYFYRIRAGNEQGNSTFSLLGNQSTKNRMFPFLTSRIPDKEMERAIFARWNSSAFGYTYTQKPRIPLQTVDSIVQVIVNKKLSVDSLWLQDTLANNPGGINSIFIAKARRMEPELLNLGFSLVIEPVNLPSSSCGGSEYYLYHSLTSVSVKEETSEQNSTLRFSLYPNPSTTEIAVQADLPYIGIMNAEIVDILGRQMNTSSEQIYSTGTHELTFSTRNLMNGTYILRMKVLNQASGIASFYSRQFTVMR